MDDLSKYTEHVRKHAQLLGDQDDCLIALESGRRPSDRILRKLPPWRAVMIARIALRMELMTQEEVDELVEEARTVGGDGKLRLTRSGNVHGI